MWDIYAGKEQGCNIEFDENFFDLKGSSWGTLAKEKGPEENGEERNGKYEEGLDYGISTYTDDDYPLYAIQYVYRDHYSMEGEVNLTEINPGNHNKYCPQMEYDFLEKRLLEIAQRWSILHQLLDELLANYDNDKKEADGKIVAEAIDEIRAFVADRINEVRYLFKDRDYSFEGEVRLVRVVEADDYRAHTDSREIPRAFTEVNKEIKDIVVTLASKLSDEQVNEITTWLKHTGRVKDVRIATRNRLRWFSKKIYLPGLS